MIEESRLGAYVHDGFWACMDTFKEKQMLDEIHESGMAPWQVWRTHDGNPSSPSRQSWL